mgnify:FL=1
MIELSKLQKQFIHCLYQSDDNSILSEIKTGKAPKDKLFNIYRHNLNNNLTNCLMITYPNIYHILGSKIFTQYAHKFITISRSQSGNLDDYGHDFAQFLKDRKEGFLSDLAHAEWLRHKSYLAQDSMTLELEKLQQLSIEDLADIIFKLQPSCFIYKSYYNLHSSRKRKKPGNTLYYYIIYREDFDTHFNKISKTDFHFLNAIKNKQTLSQMHDQKIRNIQSCISKYIQNNIINFVD